MPRPNDLTPPAAARRGATLLGALSGMLVLGLLALLALPLCLGAEADNQKKTCRANMQTIANAVQAAYVESGDPDFTGFAGPVDPKVEKDLLAVPICPSGGHYRVIAGPGTTNDGRPVLVGAFAVQCDYRPAASAPANGKDRAKGNGKAAPPSLAHGSYMPGDK